MKKILSILLLSIIGISLSCGGVNPITTTDDVATSVKLKIAVQGQVDATLKLTAIDYTFEKLLSEVSNDIITVPINREITATLTPVDEKEVSKIFWYGGTVSNLSKDDLTNFTMSFKLKEASYLGVYIDSKELVLNNVVIDLATETGSVIVFDKTNRVGPLEYTLPTGFALDLEARDFDDYEFDSWKTKNGTLISDKVKFSLKISSDTNIKPEFIGGQNFTFKASMGGSIKVVIKKGTSTLSTTTIPANKTVTIPISSSRFTDGSVIATAIANADTLFENWTTTTTNATTVTNATKANLNILESMKSTTITANFDFKNKWDGKVEEPKVGDDAWIHITKPAHLKWLADTVNGGTNGTNAAGKKYKIMNDIDYAGGTHTPVGYSGNSGDRYGFSGVIDGNGFSIKNAVYAAVQKPFQYTTGQMAFVGFLTNGGIISNLTIDESVVIISGVFNSPTYSTSVAGIVAYNEGQIYNSVNKADIFSTGTYVGGIVALVSGGTSSTTKPIISNVYNSGNVNFKSSSQPNHAGGIAGLIERDKTIIVNAYNTGNITNISTRQDIYIGGIVGGYGGMINNIYYMTNVYSIGNIHGGGKDPIYAGGIIGGLSITSITINVANQFFLNKNSLATTGISSLSKVQPWTENRTVNSSQLSVLDFVFNLQTPGVWGVKDGRPYIIGLEK